MVWVAITGAMGSGKSTVSRYLVELGYAVLDADEIARSVLGPGSGGEAEVFRLFGDGLRGPDGSLDRRALGRLVFSDSQRLAALESVVHPRVRSEVARLKEHWRAAGSPALFYDVPLLFEKGMESQFDHVVVVSSPPEICARRLQSRSGLTLEEIEERRSRQLPLAEKEARASVVIRNAGSLDDLHDETRAALAKLGIPLPSAAHP